MVVRDLARSRMAVPLRRALNTCLGWLGQDCIFCLGRRAPNGCCPACYTELPFIERGCLLCAAALPPSSGPWQELCVTCQHKPPPLEHAFSPLHYTVPVRRALHALKFQSQLRYARPLGQIWLARLRQRASWPDFKPDLLLPVPLHPIKLRQRGFNPSHELARPLAQYLRLPLATHPCQRVKNTAPQLKLTFAARRRNLKGAFVVQAQAVQKRNVLILDDVITSSATVHELARALRAAGAKSIAAWSLMRA